ncbi:hypothetical protein V5799_020943 [Amblyomma americanum]|uniref:Uncharacterized protein n=1 Tax=Amblyomma americanum TaxID=6943 RepID=A0AAQ4ET96_AMBAM
MRMKTTDTRCSDTKASGDGAEGKLPARRVNFALQPGRHERRVATTGAVVVEVVASVGAPPSSVQIRVGPAKHGPVPSASRPSLAAAASSSSSCSGSTRRGKTSARPPAKKDNSSDDFEHAGLLASNATVDAVLAELRARHAVQAQLANCLWVPDFDAGRVRVQRPRFWLMNTLFREGVSFMCYTRPRPPRQLPDEVQLRTCVAAHDVRLVCGFTYACFRGGLELTFDRFHMSVTLVFREGLPCVRCLEVQTIEDPHIIELRGVSSPFRKFVWAGVKKAIRRKKEFLATAVSERYKEVLQTAIGKVDMTAVFAKRMLGPRS